MTLSNEARETLRRWLPMLLVAVGAWVVWRTLKQSFWTVFGLAWVIGWSGAWRWMF